MKKKMIALSLVVAAFAGTVGRATAHTTTYPAKLRCSAISEDSAAHVKLVRYSAGGSRIVYRCASGF